MRASHRIFAVVVTFQPEERLLARLVETLAPQISHGLIVNNSSSLPLSEEWLQTFGFDVQHLLGNVGVASALNTGFGVAEQYDADFVISFDQDSEPAPDMVTRLLQAYRKLSDAGYQVGAVGPTQVDRRTGQAAVFLAPILSRRQRVLPQPGESVEVDHLITSGCLVPMASWTATGPFLAPLFVDYVDIEWCLRMRHLGWELFGVGGATLLHTIGDDVRHCCGKQIYWHSPLRHYYLFRNGVYLLQLPHIAFWWKLLDAIQLVKKFIFFAWLGRSDSAHLRAMLRGVWDGFRGRLGSAGGLYNAPQTASHP